MPDFEPDANPYSSPRVADRSPREAPDDRDTRLRHEYLGAILLAAFSGLLATVFLVLSHRTPTSDLGEAAVLAARLVSYALAIVSLLFVFITLRAASARVALLLGRIYRGRR